MPPRGILVGTGSWGAWWCEHFLPPNIADGSLAVVAAVDSNPEALAPARRFLGLAEHQCFTSAAAAFAAVPADFCIVVVPPAFHEAVIDDALAHGLHILCEKPMADSLAAAVRIEAKVRRAGRKMAVTMSHRFDQDKQGLKALLRAGRYGRLDRLVFRFGCNCRQLDSWGAFRHQMPHPMLMEGSIHHLDILADLAGAPCQTLYAQTWTPAWASYAGDCQVLALLGFENGVRAQYEAANADAVSHNPWGREYIRAECEGGTLLLDQRRLRAIAHDTGGSWTPPDDSRWEDIPLPQQATWGNTWLAAQFAAWLQGGPTMETCAAENLQASAMVEAAIQSSASGQAVQVQGLLAGAV